MTAGGPQLVDRDVERPGGGRVISVVHAGHIGPGDQGYARSDLEQRRAALEDLAD